MMHSFSCRHWKLNHISFSFQDWSVKQAGESTMTNKGQHCKCQCSGQIQTCGVGAGSWLYHDDVTNPDDCAKMICSNSRFSECRWNDTIVSGEGSWNGDNIEFTSIALQETCKGLTGTSEIFLKSFFSDWISEIALLVWSARDFCGVVATIETTEEVPATLSWVLRNQNGVEITRYSNNLVD